MPVSIPSVAVEYFAAANAFDVDRTVALFADDASVTDEGQEIRGREAIREWVNHVMKAYAATATPESSDVLDGTVAVRALVSGDFPGSPVRLTYRFRTDLDRIVGLHIQ